MVSKRINTTRIMVLSTSSLVVCAFLLATPMLPIKRETKSSLGYPRDSLLNFTELTTAYGYVSEEHTVTTDDGYILTMFRIVKGKRCPGKNRFPPVLLVHGLLQSSDSFIDSGPNSGIAYLIADACHDLWVGNVRGNYYSRHHVRLNPDKDQEFWNFYIDEMGRYDIPAMIDYVLDYTGAAKLNHVGFSQGTGTFLVMCSERPGYCDKVNIHIGLAPAARQFNSKSQIFRSLTQTMANMESVLSLYGIGEVLSKGSVSQEFVAFFCYITDYTRNICAKLIDLFDHVHTFHSSINKMTTEVLFGHFPSGTSLHNMARYGQAMRSRHFEKFNYGRERNLELYGSEMPPRYNLSSVLVPVVCIYGINDGLVDTADVKWLVSKLPNVLEAVEVPDPAWTHLDVTYSQYTKKIIFPKLYEYLTKYSVE